MAERNMTPLDFCDGAAELLRKAGFIFVCASMKSTSCYYRLPDRSGTLRVSIHGRKKDRAGVHQTGRVHAQATFPAGSANARGILDKGHEYLEGVVARAIGIYMLRAPLSKTGERDAG
jgi:hypothetical protein